MEVISLKLDEAFLQRIDEALKRHNYSTRTEFIRDALRHRLEALTLDPSLALQNEEKSFYHG